MRGLFLLLALLGFGWWSEPLHAAGVSIRGKVTAKGVPLEGAYVAAHAAGAATTTYVMTDRRGEFAFQTIAPGNFTLFTRIAGFRTIQKDSVSVQAGKEVVANFQVEPETIFSELVEQASNAELLDSFPLTPAQREALDHRCTDCHGEYYIAKSRFSLKDWKLIVARMDDAKGITPAGDLAPPPPFQTFTRRDAGTGDASLSDESIAAMLAQIRGEQSPDFPIHFRPRATGQRTRAVVTEFQIPRLGATPRAVAVDPRGGYVWYTDWRANFLGRVEIKTGEIKEYPVPGRDGRPPGFQYTRWDSAGNLLAGQIWSGRGVLFDVKNERVAGQWQAPQDWARTGSFELCRMNPDGSAVYKIGDSLIGTNWILDGATDKFLEIKKGSKNEEGKCDPEKTDNHWRAGWSPGGGNRSIYYKDPATGKTTEFPIKVSPWARPYNAVGDNVRKVGWTVPDSIDSIVKVDAATGQLTEFPLPSHGKEVRNIDIETSDASAAIWFVNQRLGRIVRFQETVE